jgi:two-component system, response regulator YesN
LVAELRPAGYDGLMEHTMYTFLMVDDEEIIRRGFSERVAWADYGFTFLEPCRNGTDAIAAVTALQPDVVLTDINMPGVNGLEVCAFVAENYPATTLVILSGYDEFEYAQKALSFKVFDYILKPVNVKKMGDLLTRLKDHLDTESSFRNSVELLSRQAEQSRELIRERLLNRLITEKPGSDDFQAYEKDIGVPLPSGCARAILIDPDDPDAIRSNPYISFSIFLLAVQNACLEAAPQGGDGTLIFQRPVRQVAVIITGKTEHLVYDHTRDFVRRFYLSAKDIPYSTVTLGIGGIKLSLADVYRSFREAELAVDYRFMQGKNSAIYYDNRQKAEGQPLPVLSDDARLIAHAVKTGSAAEIEARASQFFSHLKASSISVYRSELEIQKYFIIILNALEELDITCSDLDISSTSDPILILKDMKTLEEAEAWIFNFCRLASDKLSLKRQAFSEKKVYEAMDYIAAHYGQSSLSTEQLSDQLAISAGYLSRIFKKHTNMTVLEFLAVTRIDKAKELANSTDLKNYEIAEKVGYPDPGYFATIFRKVTGMTLTEYRHSREAGSS